jgi:hypothetical protein
MAGIYQALQVKSVLTWKMTFQAGPKGVNYPVIYLELSLVCIITGYNKTVVSECQIFEAEGYVMFESHCIG